ncbi:hypothetical protein KCP70_19375 [Salmonella enterica subsp. enterica]|nr:hypothetical protein KCP70_19375 [Salmonella enterica subsp. enterica]
MLAGAVAVGRSGWAKLMKRKSSIRQTFYLPDRRKTSGCDGQLQWPGASSPIVRLSVPAEEVKRYY